MFKDLKYLYITLIVVAVIVALIILYYYFFVKQGRTLLASKPKGPVKSILFIGDSNTAADFSYADQLHTSKPNLRIKKLALNGAKTDWMLSQLKNELASTTYDAVAILGGSNDIYATGSITATKINLDAMYRLAKSKGAVVLAITPPNKDFYVNKTEQKQALLYELNSWIKANPNKDYVIDFWAMTNNKNLFSAGDGYLHAQKPAHTLLMNKTTQTLNL